MFFTRGDLAALGRLALPPETLLLEVPQARIAVLLAEVQTADEHGGPTARKVPPLPVALIVRVAGAREQRQKW